MGPKAEKAIPALIECLADDRDETFEVQVGTLAARALVAIGKPAEKPILDALKSSDVLTFIGAAQAVMLMEPPPEAALDVLFEALSDRTDDSNRRQKPRQRGWVAARVLAKYGPRAQPATGDLIVMLDSKNFHEQVAACQALGAIGKTATRAVPRLVELVGDGVTSVRGHAALTLAKIGPVEKHDIVKPMEKALDDFSAVVRARALMALAELGPEAKSALPAVQKKMRNKNYTTRCEAAYAAFRLSGDAKEPVEVLTAMAADVSFELDALTFLAKMGPSAETAAKVLLPMLKSKDPDKRFETAQTLAQIAGRSARIRAVLEKLATSDPDADVRRIAKDSLNEEGRNGAAVNQELPKLGDSLTDKQVTLFAELALKNIDIEYPNKPSNVMAGPESVQSPKAMHPAFYGCFDWHSSIHGHWMLVRLLKLHPDCSVKGKVRAALNSHLTAENLKKETEYFAKKHNRSFERMYGWAWAFRLAAELDGWDDEDGRKWAASLKPLEELLIKRTMDYLPKLAYPIRTGVHPDSGFALGQTLDYARKVGNRKLEDLIVKRSRDYYMNDRDYPFRYEPSGQDFFSSGWNEADLMRRVLTPAEFAKWLDGFMGDISTVKPVEVSDVTDGKIVHLAGLDLSRAWCMQGIASALPKDDPRVSVLNESAAAHAKMGFGYVFSGHYEGEHWLATFAIYTLTRVGI